VTALKLFDHTRLGENSPLILVTGPAKRSPSPNFWAIFRLLNPMKRSKTGSWTREKLERTARLAASRAATILRKYYARRFRVSFKGEVNLVTEADIASQKVIV
jgi:hypothetical protein